MAEEKKRTRNYSLEEKERLLDLIVQHSHIILCKNTDDTTNLAKNFAWDSIATSFNSTGAIHRDRISLMRLWGKLKHNSKIYYDMCLTLNMHAASGSYNPNAYTDPVLQRVCDLLGLQYVFRGAQGAPHAANYNYQENYQTTANNEMPATSSTTAEGIVQNVDGQTSWWYAGPPQPLLPQRTEAPPYPSDCAQRGLNKNESIEDTKHHILQEKLLYKRRLYEWNLKTAEREEQIKTEILSQIKSGKLSMRDIIDSSHI